jgi:hypothetical protein
MRGTISTYKNVVSKYGGSRDISILKVRVSQRVFPPSQVTSVWHCTAALENGDQHQQAES